MNRRLKKHVIRLFNPLDFFARVINGKRALPPLHLRWDVGPLRGFESSAAEFRLLLKLLAGFEPDHHILDIGCGCGQIALALQNDLAPDGRYVGCDINKEAVSWCNRHIAAADARFAFHHIDVRNGMYNPRGRTDAAHFRFPPEWGSFDLVLLKSVFTHMRSEEVENYLSQLPALLSADGRCLATFFLLNSAQEELAGQQRSAIHFHRAFAGSAYAEPLVPEAIVAFQESALLEMMARHGLAVRQPVQYGTWTGDRSRLCHQDIVLIEKNGASLKT